MAGGTTMTINLTPDIKEKLDRIATDTRRSQSSLAGEAIAAYVEREAEIIEGIKRGLADMEAGRLVPHDEAIAEMRAVIAEARRKKAARG